MGFQQCDVAFTCWFIGWPKIFVNLLLSTWLIICWLHHIVTYSILKVNGQYVTIWWGRRYGQFNYKNGNKVIESRKLNIHGMCICCILLLYWVLDANLCENNKAMYTMGWFSRARLVFGLGLPPCYVMFIFSGAFVNLNLWNLWTHYQRTKLNLDCQIVIL